MSKPRPRRRWRPLRKLIAGFFLSAAAATLGLSGAAAQTASPVDSPAKLPRYVSLKSDRVLLRQGPGTEYPTAWVFRRTGLPVEVLEESEMWRKVRDAGGTVGWVQASLLSGRRTALVLPWEIKEGQTNSASATLREDDRESARAVAQVEAGVLANIIGCERGWCRVSAGNYRGYIEQTKLWGTYPAEEIKP